MKTVILADDFVTGRPLMIDVNEPVAKHGDHDQSTHGSWAASRGGKPDKYRGAHDAPSREFGSAMHDLTGTYPEDVYSSNGSRYYGTGNKRADSESFAAIHRTRGKPDAKVTMYRAVPRGVKRINPGDWVTPSLTYAMEHGEGPLSGEYDIASAEARAGDLWNNGDSINEWGWDPIGGGSVAAVTFPKLMRRS